MKYELIKDQTIDFRGNSLFRIRALRSFGIVKAGELGGWIEKEENLSQEDLAWVADNARVAGSAKILGNAEVRDRATVCDYAVISGDAWVGGSSWVEGHAKVGDNAEILGTSVVKGNAEIGGDASINGASMISGNGLVTNGSHHITISPFVASDDSITFFRTSDNKIAVINPNFNGVREIDAFIDDVKNVYDKEYSKFCLLAAEIAKLRISE